MCIKLSGCDIKRLGLGCLDITGSGLEPIHGSTSLEQLDVINTGVTVEILLSILESIVDADGSAIKHLPGAFSNEEWARLAGGDIYLQWKELRRRYRNLIKS